MGALSPRTRNAQVALYQNGDVDYLVATDAIGMGLNLDIKHVAFSATAKFDGRRMRALYPQELAQIAGRAGRHTEDGTFGVTGEARPFDEDLVEAIENHRFAPVKKLHWRNEQMDFGTADRLIRSLEAPTSNEWLTRARDADDVLALKALSALPEVRDRLTEPKRVQLLWDVCRIPDFRSIDRAGTCHASDPDLRVSGRSRPWRRAHPVRLAGHRDQADRQDRRRHRHAIAHGWPISAPGPT